MKKALRYIDAALDAMVARPLQWGPHPCVEIQAIRFLKIRGLLLNPDETPHVMERFRKYLRAEFPDMASLSLASRLEGAETSESFGECLRRFTDEIRAEQDQQRSR